MPLTRISFSLLESTCIGRDSLLRLSMKVKDIEEPWPPWTDRDCEPEKVQVRAAYFLLIFSSCSCCCCCCCCYICSSSSSSSFLSFFFFFFFFFFFSLFLLLYLSENIHILTLGYFLKQTQVYSRSQTLLKLLLLSFSLPGPGSEVKG